MIGCCCVEQRSQPRGEYRIHPRPFSPFSPFFIGVFAGVYSIVKVQNSDQLSEVS
jgi:hypothetical protein